MRYMVIERFRDGKVGEVYRRVEQRGRQLPAGLTYVGSWITDDLERCFQVMECNNPELLSDWMSQWSDLVDFEVMPVIGSDEAKKRALGGNNG